MSHRYIDAHIHLDKYEEIEVQGLLSRAVEQGVEAVVAVSMGLESCQITRQLAHKYEGRILPAYGFHPEQEIPDATQVDQLFNWIEKRRIAGEAFAIGEIGLPYYMRTEREAAKQLFCEQPYLTLLERFIAYAAKHQLPVVLHAVYEDADKACDLLEKYDVQQAHFHWFKGSEATIARMIQNRFFISITPDVAYETEIQALVKQYPLDLLMVETDGPWGFEQSYAGRMTESAWVSDVAAHIADIKQLPLAKVSERLYENTIAFYGR